MKKIYILLMIAMFIMTGCSSELEVLPTDPIETIGNDYVQSFLDKDTNALLNDYVYDNQMKKAFNEELIESVYADLESRFGTYVKKGEAVISENAGYDIVTFFITYEKGYVNHNVVFDADKRIAGYNYVTAQAPEGDVVTAGDLTMIEIAINFANDLYNKETKRLIEIYPYDATMKSVLTGAKLNELILDIENKYGKAVNIWTTEEEVKSGYEIVSVITEFESVFLSLNIIFDENKEIAGINYYETTSPETEESGFAEVKVAFGQEPWIIDGMISRPVYDSLVPAVVLVHGSGPNDKDETIYGNKPFLDIAKGLYNHGIAVLRYDKRTMTYGQLIFNEYGETFTIYDETIDDAVAAVEYLKTVPGIDPEKIFILGHSLGANQSPRIAEKADVAGLLLVAGNVTPLQDLMLAQYEYIYNLDGTIDASELAGLEQITSAVEKINSDNMSDYPRQDLLGINHIYWADMKDYNPVELAMTLDIPIALFQGARDYQVPVSEYDMWVEGLPGADAYFYPTLNHLMITGEGEPTPEEYLKVGHVDQTFIDDMAAWIKSK